MNKIAIAAALAGVLAVNAALAALACPARGAAQSETAWRSAVGGFCQASWVKDGRGVTRAHYIESCLRRCQAHPKTARSAHAGDSSGPILAATGAAAGVSAAVAAAHLTERPASP